MDLNLARTFVAVAEARSFTAAARTLGVPTSSVSRAVVRLEAQLSARLFVRSTRKTSLTAAGRTFLEHASRALHELEEGERRVGELAGQPRGEIRITLPMNVDDGFLARQLVAFALAYPQVKLTLLPTNRMVDLLEEAIDLALRVQTQPDDGALAMQELGRFHAWLVAAPSYLARRGQPRRPQDLVDHDCIRLQPQRSMSQWPLSGPHGVEVVDVRGPICADDMQLAEQLIEAGAGIGTRIFAPGSKVSSSPGVVRVLPDYIVQGPALYVVTPSRKNLPLRVSMLRGFLVRAYAEVRGSPS